MGALGLKVILFNSYLFKSPENFILAFNLMKKSTTLIWVVFFFCEISFKWANLGALMTLKLIFTWTTEFVLLTLQLRVSHDNYLGDNKVQELAIHQANKLSLISDHLGSDKNMRKSTKNQKKILKYSYSFVYLMIIEILIDTT